MIRKQNIIALALSGFMLFGFSSASFSQDSNHWPKNIYGNSAFNDIGHAIAGESGFPLTGTEVEKARYAMSRLPEVVRKYDLATGANPPFGIFTGGIIGISRMADHLDKEDVNSLKSTGWGNCAEFSMAFQELLKGAGVQTAVVYGDKSSDPGYALSFGGTDTALMVEEKGADGKISRRIFDPFRAIFHAQRDSNPPTMEESVREWSDRPMSKSDIAPRDGDPNRIAAWKDDGRIGKPFVKDEATHSVLPPTVRTRIAKPTDQNEKAAMIEHIRGRWKEKGGSEILIQGDNGSLHATNVKRSPQERVMGVPENSTYFTNGYVKSWQPLVLVSNNTWNFKQEGDCPDLAPHTKGETIITFAIARAGTANGRSRVPQYYSQKCIWATNQPWTVHDSVWTKIKSE